MFSQGLSLDQAPPISVVFRFFLTVPLFGIPLALLMIFYPHQLLTQNHPISLSAIHLLFLGIITMSMIGALFQMQSVLGGRPIPSPKGNAYIIHLLLSVGTLALASAFYFYLLPLFVIAGVLLGSALVYAVFLVLPLLFKSTSHDTLRGMRLALISLFITTLLGIVMASSLANESPTLQHEAIRSLHYSFGLMGWIGALIIAVSFQVIEMFYVTTPYSPWCKRNAFRIIAAALLFKMICTGAHLSYGWMGDLVIAALLLGFSFTTLRRLKERKRRVSDVSIWFWTAGLVFLTLAIFSYLGYLLNGHAAALAISVIAFALYALSIIIGMMSKIVPFLVWFHLNAQGYMETPIMSHVIPANRNKLLFALFIVSALGALLSPFFPPMLSFSGVGTVILFSLLGYNLIQAVRLYWHVRTTGNRFEMSIPL